MTQFQKNTRMDDDIPLVLLRMVTLATLVHARLALTAQFAANHVAAHQAATCAVSRIVSFGKASTVGVSASGLWSRSIDAEVVRRCEAAGDKDRARVRGAVSSCVRG